jgi:hypothetical protein
MYDELDDLEQYERKMLRLDAELEAEEDERNAKHEVTFISLQEMVNYGDVPPGATITCNWFANCNQDAIGAVIHSVLGAVLTCARCTEFATGMSTK